MVGKSKGKQKGLPEVDLVVSKTAAENEKALEITRRLRKGHSLESLVKEAQALANDHPSAISLLCLAKVVLAQAVDGLMSNSLTGEARAEIRYAQQQQLNKAMTDACTGASEHASILCGRFYYRLAEIAQPDFDSLKWPHVDNLVDPQTELLEQEANLCDFETWKEWKDQEPKNVKLKMRLEMETSKKKVAGQRRMDNAAEIGEAILKSGLLYESTRHHLHQALKKHQTNHERQMKLRQAQIMQLTGHSDLEQAHLFERIKPADDDDNQRSAHRAEELEKRIKQKKEDETAMRKEWFEEVVRYVKQEVTQHMDNDERLASLVQLSSIPVDDILRQLVSEASPTSPEREMMIKRVAKGIASLIPEEGGVCSSTQVIYDHQTEDIEPFQQAVPRLKEDVVHQSLRGSTTQNSLREELKSAKIDDVPFANEVWCGTWSSWSGKVPPDMSPLDSVSELMGCLESSPDAYEPTPLAAPSAGLCTTVTKCLLAKITDFHANLDMDDASSSVADNLKRIMGHKVKHSDILQDVVEQCYEELPGLVCELSLSLEDVPEFMPSIDLSLDFDISIAEAQALNNKSNARQHLKTRGQLAVTMTELLAQAQADPDKLPELGSLYLPNQDLYRLESRLEGRKVSASDFAGADGDDEANGRSVDSDDPSDGGSTVDMENGKQHLEEGAAAAWWNVVHVRFSTEKIRAALLEEIRLAAHVLLDAGCFSAGIAAAISCHIYTCICKDVDFDKDVFLDHARVLDEEPLKALLDFLWVQLGLRWSQLPQVLRGSELSVCNVNSNFEFLPDSTVRYSLGYLRHMNCSLQAEQLQKKDQATSDAQSPERWGGSHQDPQLEKELLPNGCLSPQQQQEAQQKQIDAEVHSEGQYRCCCFASGKPEISEDFLRHFVQHLLFAEPAEQTEQEEESTKQQLNEQQAEMYYRSLVHTVFQAVDTARSLADAFATLVYHLDLFFKQNTFPHTDPVPEHGRHELLAQINPAHGRQEALEAIAGSLVMGETRAAALQLPRVAAEAALDANRNQQRTSRSVQAGFKRMHMDTLQNMGCQTLNQIEDLCKGEQLYNPGIIRTQEEAETLASKYCADSQQLHNYKDDVLSKKVAADDARLISTALETYRYYMQGSLAFQDARKAMQHDEVRHVGESLNDAVESMVRMWVRLDMQVLQINCYQSYALESKCETVEEQVRSAHVDVLRARLIQAAKNNKAHSEQEAAERNALELLATEAQSKSHTEGGQKKGKKKKKGSKQREEKQEDASIQENQEQEPVEEGDWEQVAEGRMPLLPPGLQNGTASSSRSPLEAQPDKDEDHWRRLPGVNSVQEGDDWNMAGKKKGGKGKIGSKQPDAATAAAATPNSWEDGWQDTPSTSDPPGPAPPGLYPRSDPKPASNDENRQPEQEPAASSGHGNSEPQCERCGKWGHTDKSCSETFCDVCQKHGHNTAKCPQRSMKAVGRGGGEQERAREARLGESQRKQHDRQPREGGLCHHCKQPGHIAAACPEILCYNCQQYGHKAPDCPNPPASRSSKSKTVPLVSKTAPLVVSRRHGGDAQNSSRQQGTAAGQPEEQQRGRQRGRGRDQQAESSSGNSATLPITKSGRRGKQAAQQDQGADYPSLPGPPPGIPIPPSDSAATGPNSAGFTQPPPPPPRTAAPQWGPSRSAQPQPELKAAGGRGHDRPRTPGWGHSESLQEQAASAMTGDEEEDDDDSSFHSLPASPLHQSPHRSQSHMQAAPAGAVWGNRPSSARSLGLGDSSDRLSQSSAAVVSGQSHAALAHGMLQPGMDEALQASAWSGSNYGPQSLDTQHLGLRLPDQLASSSDPIVSPAFMHRSAPARAYQPQQLQQQQQQQQPFFPAAPLASFASQEAQGYPPQLHSQAPVALLSASAAVVSDDDSFLNDVLAEQEEDNRPVGIYGAPAAGAVWPGLGDPSMGPGAKTWALTVDNKVDNAGEEDEADEELQKALQASLEETQSEQKQTAYANELMRRGASDEAASSSTMGLRNATGEYNCFLNVIIQCLWHCRVFRQSVMDWHPAAFEDNDVVKALIGLFKAFAERERSKAPTQAVDPTQLRVALGNLEGDKFRVGQMGDAAEVLTALYDKLASVAAKAGQASLLDDNFGLHVRENVHCHDCGKDSHQHSYVQYFFNVISSSLPIQRVFAPKASLGQLLCELERQTLKSCDTDKGGCNQANSVQHFLEGEAPHIFTMQLAWQSNNEKSTDIKATMEVLSQELDLGEVYIGMSQRKHVYHLRSMVCYYGQHYLAFVLMAGNTWFMFDDASMQRVGSWADVITKSALGRTQASVLFFEHE